MVEKYGMTDSQNDTSELLRRAAHSDSDATEQLVARHRDRLRRLVGLRLDQRLSARLDPSDIVQDVLAEAIQKLPDYVREKPVSFYPWLRRMAMDRMIEVYRMHVVAQKRSVQREKPVGLPLPDQSTMMLADLLAARQKSPSQQMANEQLIGQVREALTKLQENDRELLVLRYLEQLSLGEIAEVLDCTETAIKSRHIRALKRLGLILTQSDSSDR